MPRNPGIPAGMYQDRHGQIRHAIKRRRYIAIRRAIDMCRRGRWDRDAIALLTRQFANSLTGAETLWHRTRVRDWLNHNTRGQTFVLVGSDVYPESDTIREPVWRWIDRNGGHARMTGERGPIRLLSYGQPPTCGHCGVESLPIGWYWQAQHAGRRITICANCRCDHYVQDEDDGIYYLRSEHRARQQNQLLSYSANPIQRLPSFLVASTERKMDQTMFLGVELEVCPRDGYGIDDGFRSFRDTLGEFAIAKHDGSVSNGFEICTVPATLAYHQTAWDRFFAETAPKLSGFRARNCGMHVHIARASMSKLGIGRLMAFITDPANNRFMSEIAGRDQNEYCRRSPKKVSDGALNYTDHYDAVSISGHTRATVEVRIFKSNVAKLGFFKNLEFTAAAAGFAMATSNRDLDIPSFCRFVCTPQQVGLYPNLATWLDRRGYIRLNRNPAPNAPAVVTDQA